MQRQGVGPPDAVAVGLVELGTGELLEHGLVQPGGGLAGGRGQGHGEPLAECVGLGGEQHQEPGDRGGLAGAGAAGEHRGRLPHGPDGGGALLGAEPAAGHPLERGGEGGLVDRRAASRRSRVSRSSQTWVSSRW